MRMIEYQKNSVELNLVLAQKKLAEGDAELAAHRMQDARRALQELFAEMKKANDAGTSSANESLYTTYN